MRELELSIVRLLTMLVVVFGLIFMIGVKGEKDCDKNGGDYVKGVFWFKCLGASE